MGILKVVEVIDQKDKRDSLIDKVEVLEKVKELLLLPNTDFATTQQVAEFYEVSVDTVKMTIKHYRDEIEGDGYLVLTGKEVVDSLKVKNDLKRIETSPPILTTYPSFSISSRWCSIVILIVSILTP